MEYGGFKMEVWRSMVKRIIILLFVFSSILSFGQANRFAGFGCKTCNCDTIAQKYIDSSGITDATEKSAVCSLVKWLKDSSIYSKIIIIYPFRGGTATSCKWTIPVNSTYTATFSGGWTFSYNGANPNGTNSVANTHWNPSTSGTLTSQAFGYDSRENTCSAGIDFGVDNNVNNIYGYLTYCGSNTAYSAIYSASFLTPNRIGANYFYQVSRVGTNLLVYDNGSLLTSGTLSTSSLYNGSIEFGKAGREVDFFYIATGLSSTELRMMYNILQQFKSALGI